MKKTLLVIIPDRLSDIINKGEIVPRYYNPNNLFEEVHIMMTNDDHPNPKLVQPMVGNADLYLHNHPIPKNFFKKTLGWIPLLMKNWINSAIPKVSCINPNIIRCYGADLNLVIATHIKKKLKIPFLVSLHTHPLLDDYKANFNLKEKIIKNRQIQLTRYLKESSLVLPVYKGICSFLENRSIKHYQILYNAVRNTCTSQKLSSNLEGCFKIICVGIQEPNKNPENLIKSVSQLKNVSLDIIGTGPLNKYLKKLTNKLKASTRIKFIDSIHNAKLCNMLQNYDCFAANIDCIGLSKSVIEAFLAKLPVLLNINSREQVPELNDSICLRVPDTVEGYTMGIQQLKNNDDLRINLAQNAYKFAQNHWNPNKIEKQHADIYTKYLIA